MADDSIERAHWQSNRYLGVGEEAGYGCGSGQMWMAFVIFPKDFDFTLLPGLNDSKKLTQNKRFELEPLIKEHALHWKVISATVNEINSGNIYWLRFAKLAEYVIGVQDKLPDNLSVIMDGNVKLKLPPKINSDCLVKGDSKCLSISAASVLAKTAKDKEMIELDKQFPMYKWKDNCGYITADHIEAVKKYGLTAHHRPGFFKKILGSNE